jgi:DNA-binding transcriptional MerR regulator
MPDSHNQTQLIRFLQQELGVSLDSIALALRQQEFSLGSLPMILWQLGLISLNQLDSTFTWLEEGYR